MAKKSCLEICHLAFVILSRDTDAYTLPFERAHKMVSDAITDPNKVVLLTVSKIEVEDGQADLL